MKKIKRIAILTSGGDCSGLNAVIEGVTKTAAKEGIEVYGFIKGYDGLYDNDYMVLTAENTDRIGETGGSIIKNSNKTNLFNHRVVVDGKVVYRNDSSVAVENLKKDEIDAIVIVGGDGSMTSARDLKRAGVNVVCVPKTIDNDVPYTDQTFGYQTAIDRIAEALNDIRTTGYSHDRVMLLEVMGRHAGWLALEGGLAGNADFIILPEIKYNLDNICKKLIERYEAGKQSTVICVSEGAEAKDGGVVAITNSEYPDSVKLGGIGQKLAYDIESRIKDVTGQEVRSTNLAYCQRGGNTNSYDKVLSYKYGAKAVEAILNEDFGKMVALKGVHLEMVALEEVVGNGPVGETSKGGNKNVTEDSDLLKTARLMGIYLGE